MKLLHVIPFVALIHTNFGLNMPSPTADDHSLSPSISTLFPYKAPSWCSQSFSKIPSHRLQLGNLPTPLHIWRTTESSTVYQYNTAQISLKEIFNRLNVTFLMKRDDMSGGCELGGNKIRKLEFLLADALIGDYNAVITIGGDQSNHCRATATAARMVGLTPHLILRTRKRRQCQNSVKDTSLDWFGASGNILFDRMVGANIYTCTPGEYARIGSNILIERLARYLERSLLGSKPYRIPVGGSNGLGSWGYIQAVDEILDLLHNCSSNKKLHVVFSSGSGGTAAGLVLGLTLACLHYKWPVPQIHAIGVCDDPDYFYKSIAEIVEDMGFANPCLLDSTLDSTEHFIRSVLNVYQGKGAGYAVSSKEELDFVSSFAIDYGVALDPVYTGKALYYFITEVVNKDEERFRGTSLLFWHTGGSLGLYDKEEEMLELFRLRSPVIALDVSNRETGIEENTILI